MRAIISIVTGLLLSGCSVIGQSDVETAPYTLLQSDQALQIEVRNYNSMVLVSTSMSDQSRNNAFRKLFKYITGENAGATEISMTAPVFMNESSASDQGTEIAMTAPVFMDQNSDTAMMSFVMPRDFTLATTPQPKDPAVTVSELKDYKVVAIQFSGLLSDSNVNKYTRKLNQWITNNGYIAISAPIRAGYNGPLTIPMFRRNEVMIEVE